MKPEDLRYNGPTNWNAFYQTLHEQVGVCPDNYGDVWMEKNEAGTVRMVFSDTPCSEDAITEILTWEMREPGALLISYEVKFGINPLDPPPLWKKRKEIWGERSAF